MLEGKDDLCTVELGTIFVKRLTVEPMQVIEKLPTIDELHDHVQERSVLEGELQLHDERVIEPRQDISLSYAQQQSEWVRAQKLLTFDAIVTGRVKNHLLLYHLHRIESLIDFVLDEIDLAEAPLPDHFDKAEVNFSGLGGAPIVYLCTTLHFLAVIASIEGDVWVLTHFSTHFTILLM